MRNKFKEIVQEHIKRPGIENLMNYLENETDFYSAPCSTKYHLACYSGLLQHSINVYYNLKQLCDLYNQAYSDETIAIVSLFHDLCKTNYYVGYPGQYKVNDTLPIGHGEKSIFLLQKFINLTDEEAIAIRWHMSAYDSAVKGGDLAYNNAQKYSLVTLLQVADQLSTFITEKNC